MGTNSRINFIETETNIYIYISYGPKNYLSLLFCCKYVNINLDLNYYQLINYYIVKSLYQLGARHVWVLSTLPLGCLPGARTSLGGPLRLCGEILNQEAQIFNSKLSSAAMGLRSSLPYFDVRFIDVYTPMLNLINNPLSAGHFQYSINIYVYYIN